MIQALDSLGVTQSVRRPLRPGCTFRVARGSGPYLAHSGEASGVDAGIYRCLSIWRDSRRPRRVYCDAVFCGCNREGAGRVHTLYVDGPKYRSGALPDLVIVPYRVTVLSETSPRSTATQRTRRTQRETVRR